MFGSWMLDARRHAEVGNSFLLVIDTTKDAPEDYSVVWSPLYFMVCTRMVDVDVLACIKSFPKLSTVGRDHKKQAKKRADGRKKHV